MNFNDDEIIILRKLIEYFSFDVFVKKPTFEEVRELAKKIGMSDEWIETYL